MDEQQAHLAFNNALRYIHGAQPTKAIATLEPLALAFPKNPNVLFLMGIAKSMAGDKEAAIQCYDRALDIHPDLVDAHINRAVDLYLLGNFQESLKSSQSALKVQPDNPLAWLSLGNAQKGLQNYTNALTSYDHALAINPNYAEAWNNRGEVLHHLGDQAQSLNSSLKAIEFCPDYPEAYYNLGITYAELERFDEACTAYVKATQLEPNHYKAYTNLGILHTQAKCFDKAFAAYNKALALNPNDHNTLWNKSLALLMTRNYAEGWRTFESRNHRKNHPRIFDKPLWLGQEDISDKTILLHSEQGFGDTLQFCRYVDLVASRCQQVLLIVQEPLVSICKTLASNPIVLFDEVNLPAFDMHCPLMSLPLALGTTIETIPAKVPYLFADPAKTIYWREKISGTPGLKVGLVWRSGFHPDHPESWRINARRDIPLDQLLDLAIPGVSFFSLQKGGEGESDLRQLKNTERGGTSIIDYVNELHDFSDTAALIESLDLVISVCTSVAHLAGALGKPFVVLNRFEPDWRWDGETVHDSFWYPTAKIYTQPTMGNWRPVINEVQKYLKFLCSN